MHVPTAKSDFCTKKNVRALLPSLLLPVPNGGTSAKFYLLKRGKNERKTKKKSSLKNNLRRPVASDALRDRTLSSGTDSGIYTSCATIIVVTRTHTNTHTRAAPRRRTRGGNANKKKTQFFLEIAKFACRISPLPAARLNPRRSRNGISGFFSHQDS